MHGVGRTGRDSPFALSFVWGCGFGQLRLWKHVILAGRRMHTLTLTLTSHRRTSLYSWEHESDLEGVEAEAEALARRAPIKYEAALRKALAEVGR